MIQSANRFGNFGVILTAAKLKGDSCGDSYTYDIAALFVGKSQALRFDLLAARSGLSLV